MSETIEPGSWEKWAHFRFAVVGPLLAAPPESGELQAQLLALSQQLWRHPISGQLVRFGVSTIERLLMAVEKRGIPAVKSATSAGSSSGCDEFDAQEGCSGRRTEWA